jgi:isopentenyl phosphate kinase
LFHLRSDVPAYEDSVNEQVQQIIAKKGRGDLGKLLHGSGIFGFFAARSLTLCQL